MRNTKLLSKIAICTFVFALAGFSARAAQVPAPLPEPAPIPQSIFESAPPAGKDPFFPNSARGPKITKTEPVVVRIPEITLKGITGTVSKRLCILNNRTFEVGETAEMKVSGQSITVKCLEIKTKSAVVTINGIEKELNLVPR
jgi:hypothetical protein